MANIIALQAGVHRYFSLAFPFPRHGQLTAWKVVQKVDNAIHWITQLVSLTLIRWIVIYPVESAIELSNRGL